MKRKVLAWLLPGLLLGSTIAANAATIFYDDFNSSSLGSEWNVVSTGWGSYSLENTPGSLRYNLDGNRLGSSGAWRGLPIAWNPSTTLSRQFTGESWVFDTKFRYNLHSNINGGSTGAQTPVFNIAFDSYNYLGFYRNVDWWYDSLPGRNGLGSGELYYVDNNTRVASNAFQELIDIYDSMVAGWVGNEYYLKIIRESNNLIAQISADGINYTTAFDVMFSSQLSNMQTIYLDETLWDPVGSYIEYDYMKAEAIVPEPSTMLLFSIGLAGLLWRGRRVGR